MSYDGGDEGAAAIARLPRLKRLRLDFDPDHTLTGKGLRHLSRLSSLETGRQTAHTVERVIPVWRGWSVIHLSVREAPDPDGPGADWAGSAQRLLVSYRH
jgi:hypothetical protein